MGILLADEQIIYDMVFWVLSPIHTLGLIAYNPIP